MTDDESVVAAIASTLAPEGEVRVELEKAISELLRSHSGREVLSATLTQLGEYTPAAVTTSTQLATWVESHPLVSEAPVPAVIVYGKDDCVRCRATQNYLQKHGTSYVYVDAVMTPGVSASLKALGFRSLPVVQTATESWSDYRVDKLRSLASRPPTQSHNVSSPDPGGPTMEWR